MRRDPSSQMPRRKPISPTVAPMYADRRAPAASTSSTSPGVARIPHAAKTIVPTYPAPKIAHASVCQTALPSVRTPPVRTTSPRLPAFGDEAVADAGDANLLARRSGGRRDEEVTCEPVERCAAFFGGPLDARPPRGREHRRQREGREQGEGRVNRHQERDGDAETQDPAARREQRHVHVVEHEHLIAQHREPIEVVGTFVCSMVDTDACSFATCDSSAIVTWSRKRRCVRSLITRRNQVAAADTPSPTAAPSTSVRSRRAPRRPAA